MASKQERYAAALKDLTDRLSRGEGKTRAQRDVMIEQINDVLQPKKRGARKLSDNPELLSIRMLQGLRAIERRIRSQCDFIRALSKDAACIGVAGEFGIDVKTAKRYHDLALKKYFSEVNLRSRNRTRAEWQAFLLKCQMIIRFTLITAASAESRVNFPFPAGRLPAEWFAEIRSRAVV